MIMRTFRTMVKFRGEERDQGAAPSLGTLGWEAGDDGFVLLLHSLHTRPRIFLYTNCFKIRSRSQRWYFASSAPYPIHLQETVCPPSTWTPGPPTTFTQNNLKGCATPCPSPPHPPADPVLHTSPLSLTEWRCSRESSGLCSPCSVSRPRDHLEHCCSPSFSHPALLLLVLQIRCPMST